MIPGIHFPDSPNHCPFGQECTKCRLFVRASGQNPTTGEAIDDFECAIVLSAVMAGDNGRSIRQLITNLTQQTTELAKRQDRLLALVERNAPETTPPSIDYAISQD